MKLGTENRTKTLLALGLLVVGIFLFGRNWFSSGPEAAQPPAASGIAARPTTPPAPESGPASRTRGTTRDSKVRYVAAPLKPSLDPRLRLDLLKDSEHMKYEGTGRNIFAEHLEDIPQPNAPGLKNGKGKTEPPKWTPPPQPSPPPITIKFYGWASRPGEPKAVFLSQGDSVFVAREGEIINRRYRVVKIEQNRVEIEDMLSNNRQSIPLTQG